MMSNKKRCKTCCFDHPAIYISEFYIDDTKQQHFLVICEDHTIYDMTINKTFFTEKIDIYNEISSNDLVSHFNEIYDFTQETLPEIVKNYTNIPMDAIDSLGIKWGSLGCCSYKGNYGGGKPVSYKDIYEKGRYLQIEERKKKSVENSQYDENIINALTQACVLDDLYKISVRSTIYQIPNILEFPWAKDKANIKRGRAEYLVNVYKNIQIKKIHKEKFNLKDILYELYLLNYCVDAFIIYRTEDFREELLNVIPPGTEKSLIKTIIPELWMKHPEYH